MAQRARLALTVTAQYSNFSGTAVATLCCTVSPKLVAEAQKNIETAGLTRHDTAELRDRIRKELRLRQESAFLP